MNKYFKVIGSAAIVLVLSASVALAAQNGSKKPLVLVDANGTFLGDIVNASYFGPQDGIESFTTYLPSSDALIYYTVSYANNTIVPGVALVRESYYVLPDCSGTAYQGADSASGNNGLQTQWVLSDGAGQFYKNGAISTIQAVSSDIGGCHNFATTSQKVFDLIPVTLPAGIVNPSLPVKVTEQ